MNLRSGATRRYRQTARAEATAARERRVLDAAFEAFFTRYYDEVTLKDIAAEAGTTEQTILRNFGSKEALLDETARRLGHRLGGDRVRSVEPGEWRAAVESAVSAYEKHGDRTLLMLAQEDRVEPIRRGTDLGRAAHRRVTAEVFAPWLPAEDDPGYDEALMPFVVALDVYTWKLLRRDAGLSVEATTRTISNMIHCLLRGTEGGEDHDEI